MGLFRLLCRKDILDKEAIFSSRKAISFIVQPSPFIVPLLESISPSPICSLLNKVDIDGSVSSNMRTLKSSAYSSSPICSLPNKVDIDGSVSSNMRTLKSSAYISQPLPCLRNFFSLRKFQVNSLRMLHGSGKTEFSVEADEGDHDDIPHDCNDEEFVKDAKRICSLLANQPSSGVGSTLDQCGVEVSQKLVVEVLKKLSNAGVHALAFFRWAERQDGFRHTTEIYHHLIEALGKVKQFRLIWDLVNAMRGGGLLTRETFAFISRRYVRAKKVKEAINTFEKMGSYGFAPDLSDFNCLIDSLSKSKNVTVAQQLVYDMKRREKLSPDLKTYSILLEGWGRLLNLSRLTQVYQDMMGEGLKPDLVTYGILINAFCKCRKLEEALNIFHEMEMRNIKPTPHIYCILINGLGSNKRLDEALKYFKNFTASGFSPDLPLYNAVVGAYCWVQQYDNAYMMVDEMKRYRIGPNSRTYEVIVHHLIGAKRTEEAYQLFQRMEREENCKPELNTYTMIVRMLCTEGKVDMALKVWMQMIERGILPCMHMYLVLINRLCFENRLEEASKYFRDMLDRGLRPPGQLYSNLNQSLQHGGRADLAIVLGKKLDEARNTQLIG